MSRLTPDGTVEPVSRGQIIRREPGQRNINFLCSADYEKDWQPNLIYIYGMSTHFCSRKLKSALISLIGIFKLLL